MELQEKIGRYQNTTVQMYLDKEPEIRQILAEMPTAEEIKKMLSSTTKTLVESLK